MKNKCSCGNFLFNFAVNPKTALKKTKLVKKKNTLFKISMWHGRQRRLPAGRDICTDLE